MSTCRYGAGHKIRPAELEGDLQDKGAVEAPAFDVGVEHASCVGERTVEQSSLFNGEVVDDHRYSCEEAQYTCDDAPNVVASARLSHGVKVGAPWCRRSGVRLAEWRSQ